MTRHVSDSLFASPAAVLAAGPALVRSSEDPGGGVGREVFSQAEAIFGRADVSRAEFASWLHFAAKVLGRNAYAEQIVAAEPQMPWRTVWAWWRPVGAYRAEPNLSGDRSVEVHDSVRDPQGPPLVKVWSLWTKDRWFDLATGMPCAAPAAGEFTRRKAEAEDDGPLLFDTDGDAWSLQCPETWEEPLPLGAGRFLLSEARGVLVVERNPAVGQWPGGGAEGDSWEEAGGEPWFVEPDPAAAPLDTARLDSVFGGGVLCLSEARQPPVLVHQPTRAFLSGTGLPRHWAAGVTSFELGFGEAGFGQQGQVVDGLLHVGTFDLGYADEGQVLLRADTGEVLMSRNEGTPFVLAGSVEVFVRLLEAVRRHMGACWDPYPAEDGIGHFQHEVEALEPVTVGTTGPAQEFWEHVFASITELSVYGY